MQHPELESWVGVLCHSLRAPHSEGSHPWVDAVLCHLEILNTFSAKGPVFSFCLGPTSYVAYPYMALLRGRQVEKMENQLPLSAAFSQAGCDLVAQEESPDASFPRPRRNWISLTVWHGYFWEGLDG